jgi:hypothetical protein
MKALYKAALVLHTDTDPFSSAYRYRGYEGSIQALLNEGSMKSLLAY